MHIHVRSCGPATVPRRVPVLGCRLAKRVAFMRSLAVTFALLLLTPAGAQAATTVAISGTRMVVTGQPGTHHNIAVSTAGGNLVVADADEDYQSAMLKMDQANIRHLPVVSDGRLLSMLSIRDLMRVHIDHQGEELRYLHEYLYQVPSA